MTTRTENRGERRYDAFESGAFGMPQMVEIRRNGPTAAGERAIAQAPSGDSQPLERLLVQACGLEKQDRAPQADRLLETMNDVPEAALEESLLLAAVDLIELLRKRGRVAKAETVIQRILAIEPENEDLHHQFGMLLLQCGEYKYGWRERDRRFSPLPQPLWEGESLVGKTLLVQAFHGFGDTLQFVRFLPLLKARGARVILEHQPALATLLQGAQGWDRLVPRHTGREAQELEFDCHIPLMRLPVPLEIEARIPATVPYLRTDPVRTECWRERLGAEPGFKVGLVWAGNPDFKGDRQRSCRLADYAWLAQLPGVRFYSLQKGRAAEQTAHAPRKMDLVDLAPELHDFADTAAAIENLDLILTVDTAVAHLAGALGRPTWTLLPYHACWRWMLERDDSPWYPTMRLFRQPSRDDWAGVLQRLIRELDRARHNP